MQSFLCNLYYGIYAMQFLFAVGLAFGIATEKVMGIAIEIDGNSEGRGFSGYRNSYRNTLFTPGGFRAKPSTKPPL